MRKLFLVTFLLFIISPAFIFSITKPLNLGAIISASDRVALETINYKRGVLVDNKVPSFVARIFENKATYLGKQILIRIGNSFEAHYLFFNGTGFSGVLYLSYLPLVIFGFLTLKDNTKKIYIYLLVSTLIPVSIVADEFNILIRLPLFFVCCLIAGKGFSYLTRKYPQIALFLVLSIMYEFLRFTHDYIYLYVS